jgi:K+-transporting ATPase ATPase B chain
VLATSGRAVEAAGDIDVLLLDKTGTITFGNRHGRGVSPACPASRGNSSRTAAVLASLADETPEGRSIVVLASSRRIRALAARDRARFVPFTARPA